MTRFLAALAAIAMTSAAAHAQQSQPRGETVKVHFVDAKNQPVGEAALIQTPHGVLVEATLKGLSPGEHGFHFHEHGRCEPPFESAGGHFNPAHKQHGFEAVKGPHAGDLPNLVVPASGEVKVELLAPGLTLARGGSESLARGASLVVHAGPDDYTTDPAGNSGARIACAVVEAPGKTAAGARPSAAADAPAMREPRPVERVPEM
jgi:Cu-Zn family superoxide dismutase